MPAEDSVTAHSPFFQTTSNFSSSEQGSDVLDSLDHHQDVVANDHYEQEMPARPTSRLAFNSDTLIPENEASSSDTRKWASSLFQNVDIPDIPTNDKVDMDKTIVVSDSEEDKSDCSSCDESDDDSPPKLKTKAPKAFSVSRLSFPFNITTPIPRRRPAPTPAPAPAPPPPPPPPVRRKFSCLPSPLASEASTCNPQSQQRHNYAHRGYSRLAFFHTKWFWSMREEESQTDKAKSFFSHSNPLRRSRSFYSQQQPNSAPPLTIYPRRGDIGALRDPYCMHVDRCFAALPTWTIGKALWMYDMHTIAESLSDMTDTDDESIDGSASEISLDTSTSASYSDDSDTTLVESESECDISEAGVSVMDEVHKRGEGSSSVKQQGAFAGKSPSTSELPVEAKGVWTHNVYPRPSKSSARSHSRIRWPTTWYSRWELLIELSRRQQGGAWAAFAARKPHFSLGGAFSVDESSPTLSFAKTGDDGEGDQIWNEGHQMQERDIGTHVINHSFIHASHPAAG